MASRLSRYPRFRVQQSRTAITSDICGIFQNISHNIKESTTAYFGGLPKTLALLRKPDVIHAQPCLQRSNIWQFSTVTGYSFFFASSSFLYLISDPPVCDSPSAWHWSILQLEVLDDAHINKNLCFLCVWRAVESGGGGLFLLWIYSNLWNLHTIWEDEELERQTRYILMFIFTWRDRRRGLVEEEEG